MKYAVVVVALAATLPAPVWASVPLVGIDQAMAAEGPVHVAGVLDRAAVSVDGVDATFTILGPEGARLDASFGGKLPDGFSVAPVVVLVGSGGEGRFEATEILVPTAGQPVASEEPADHARGLKAVATVTMVVWLGLFAYLFGLHRKLRALEAS